MRTKTKKFKSVAGYLRSMGDDLQHQPSGLSDDERIVLIRQGQRRIVDQLLPHLDLPKLDDSETLNNGIKRLLALGGTERQAKALKDVERWLKNYLIVISSGTVCHVSPHSQHEQLWKGGT